MIQYARTSPLARRAYFKSTVMLLFAAHRHFVTRSWEDLHDSMYSQSAPSRSVLMLDAGLAR
jgi:hypothetical protein